MIRTDFYDRLINSVDCVLIENNYESSIFPLLSEYRLKSLWKKLNFIPFRWNSNVFASC